MEEKKCSTCNKNLDLDMFYNRKDAKDGKFHECKICHKKRHKKWLKTDKGKSYIKRRNQKHYDNKRDDTEFLEKRREKDRKYYAKHRDKKLAAVKRYQAKQTSLKEFEEIGKSNLQNHIEILKISLKIADLLKEGKSIEEMLPLFEDITRLKNEADNEKN
jgi:hypothetical protein